MYPLHALKSQQFCYAPASSQEVAPSTLLFFVPTAFRAPPKLNPGLQHHLSLPELDYQIAPPVISAHTLRTSYKMMAPMSALSVVFRASAPLAQMSFARSSRAERLRYHACLDAEPSDLQVAISQSVLVKDR